MKSVTAVLMICLGCQASALAQGSDPAKVAAYGKTLPATSSPALGEAERETLASSAISCVDHPQPMPANRNNYLWTFAKPAELLDGYDRNRVFFGCGTWHDAVASTWLMMSILKQDRKISLASDIKDVATTHFRRSNMDGELAFFTRSSELPGSDATGGEPMAFERPYGYAWLLKLYGEVKGSNNEDDKKVAVALAPLARWMSERYIFFLYDLKFPLRTGAESNTAWAMNLALDGANLAENETLKSAVLNNAVRLFGKDKDCGTSFEPQNSDLISSCLTEAALMGRTMPQAAYMKWLDGFLPPVYSDAFGEYAKEIDVSHTNPTGPDVQVQEAARAHLIALNFQRATEMLAIAYALPKDDARVPVLRQLAAQSAKRGYERINVAGYEGEHLIDVYALLYENEVKGPAPLGPPPKPKSKGTATEEKKPDPEQP